MRPSIVQRYTPYALAALRIVTAYLFIQHGTAKLFGFPHQAMFDGLELFSLIGLAGVLEVVGGLLLGAGLYTRPTAFVLSGMMAVAYFMAHASQGNVMAPMLNGGELAALYSFIFLLFAATGPGALSLDARNGGRSSSGVRGGLFEGDDMNRFRIAVIVGSLRKDSVNRRLGSALAKVAPPDFSFQPVRIDDLPLYNQDDDARPAEAVSRLKGQIGAARGLLFITPEYNRSIPGVLKNAIDHASRPYGQSAWAGKPAGVLGVSIGAIGTAVAQQHLRAILAYLDVPTLGQPEVFLQLTDELFDATGNIGPASRAFLQSWMDRYADWVRAHAAPALSVGFDDDAVDLQVVHQLAQQEHRGREPRVAG